MKQDQSNSLKQEVPTPKLTASRVGSIVKRRKPMSLRPGKSLTKTPSLRPVKRQPALK